MHCASKLADRCGRTLAENGAERMSRGTRHPFVVLVTAPPGASRAVATAHVIRGSCTGSSRTVGACSSRFTNQAPVAAPRS